MKTTLIVALAALALAGCEYGQTRTSFQLKDTGNTMAEAVSAAGKPVRQETRSTGETVLVYEKKTFDSENMNAKDAAVHVTFRKDAKSGQMEYSGIEFIPL